MTFEEYEGQYDKFQDNVKQEEPKEPKQELIKFMCDVNENGINIYVKSSIFEKFFEKFSVSSSSQWDGNYAYCIPESFYEHHSRIYQQLTGWKGGLYPHGYTNMSFIRAKGLKNGVWFLIKDSMYDNDEVNRFCRNFLNDTKTFYEHFIQKYMINGTVNIPNTPIKDKEINKTSTSSFIISMKGLKWMNISMPDRSRLHDIYSQRIASKATTKSYSAWLKSKGVMIE